MKQVVTTLVDDLDGGPADGTVRVGLDGVEVELDLSARNEQTLRTSLEPFLQGARRASRTVSRGTVAHRPGANRDRNQAIRAWALENGVQLPERGRIAGAVIEAYEAGDAAALYAATGVEPEPAAPTKGRKKPPAAQFRTG
jgi:autotransporter translocation and assembly factor TamB